MLGAAIVVAVIGFVLKAGAALASGWFLVPLAAVACICHVVIHAKAAGLPNPPGRLVVLSNIFLLGALLMQMEFTPGYNCAEDTLSSVTWRLGMASEEGCILLAGWPAIVIDVLLYIPAAVTWQRLLAGVAAYHSSSARR
jgi:hypothetical protein